MSAVGRGDESKRRHGRIPDEKVDSFRRQMRFYSKLNVWIYRASFGRLMNTAMGGYPICIVALTGRKSGRRHQIPLIHVPDGENKILVGSQGGLDVDPGWVHSIRADPAVRITALGQARNYHVREVEAEERQRLWPKLVASYPPYDDYKERTDRRIPVFLCEPV